MGVSNPGVNLFGNVGMMSDDIFATQGRVFYVGSTAVPGGVAGVDAAGAYGDSPSAPFATLDYAIGQCTASRGDVIVVLPGHAETVSATITMDIAGVRVIGLGVGRNRPTLTPTGAIDCINVTAANCRIHNLRFVAAASVTAHINVAAADLTVTNCVIEQGAGPLRAVTVASGGDRLRMDGCQWLGTAAGPDSAIDFETSASDDPVIINCEFNYRASAGCDEGIIRANADQVLGGLIKNCTFIKADTVAIDFNSSASVSDGIVANCYIQATAALTSIEDVVDAGGYHFYEVYAHDGTNATTAAARIPIGTVS